MKTQDTETLFRKKLNIAIPVFVFIVVTMVFRGIYYGYHGYSQSSAANNIVSSHLTVLIYAIFLIVFAAVGKAKGTENRIMAFVFGIITIVICGLLILDRALLLDNIINAMILDIEYIPSDPINIADLIVDIIILVMYILSIVFSILSIVNSAGIIKENSPSGSTTAKPAKSGFVGQPAMASTPPPASSSIPKSQFCASCGAPLDVGAAFCNKCGAKA